MLAYNIIHSFSLRSFPMATYDRVGSRFLVLTGRFQVPKNEEPVPEGRFQVPDGTCKEPGTAHPYMYPLNKEERELFSGRFD